MYLYCTKCKTEVDCECFFAGNMLGECWCNCNKIDEKNWIWKCDYPDCDGKNHIIDNDRAEPCPINNL